MEQRRERMTGESYKVKITTSNIYCAPTACPILHKMPSCITLLNPHRSSMRKVPWWPPLYRWGTWGSDCYLSGPRSKKMVASIPGTLSPQFSLSVKWISWFLWLCSVSFHVLSGNHWKPQTVLLPGGEFIGKPTWLLSNCGYVSYKVYILSVTGNGYPSEVSVYSPWTRRPVRPQVPAVS